MKATAAATDVAVRVLENPQTDLDPVLSGLPWMDAFTDGAGIDAITGNVTGSALESFEVVQRGGKTSLMHYRLVSNESDYQREVSTSVSGKYNIEGVNVSASASYLQEIKYSETALTLVAQYRVEFAEYALANNYKLTPTAAQLMATDPAKFRAAYGDYFVAGGKFGSLFTAVYVCTSSDASTMNEFKTSLGADAPEVFSVEGTASFKEATKKHSISVSCDVFAQGHKGSLPPGPWDPDKILTAVEWFSQNLDPIELKAYLQHYCTLNPLYPSSIDVDPAVFSELESMYGAYWRMLDRFESCPSVYKAQVQLQYDKTVADVRANRSRLITDATKRQQCTQQVTDLLATLDAVFDRQDFYFAVQRAAKLEPGKDSRIDETGGIQIWLYGFSAYTKSNAVVIQSQASRYSDSWHIGWRESSLNFGPDQTKLIVGWQVISNWNDGTNGGWWKTTDQNLLESQGGVHVKSLYDRGCDWTVIYYFVEAKDYLFEKSAQEVEEEGAPQAVVNIPPRPGAIVRVGRVPGILNLYNTNNPAGAQTTYNITIVDVGVWLNVPILPGHMHPYQAGDHMVFVENLGPSRLQALWPTALAEDEPMPQPTQFIPKKPAA